MMGLFTGLPGNGKTLYALNYIKALAEREGRPVFYCGITGLDHSVLPWTEMQSPADWVSLPPGAIVLIDEAQDKGFGVRIRGAKMEPWIQELEKHRHHGVDIYLITQHPMLIDAHERKLIEDHFHLVRAFGLQASKVHQFQGVRDNPDKHRTGSVAVHHFKFPKSSYAWYKSAQAHTHKAKVPMKVFVLIGLILALPVLGYYIYARLSAMSQPEKGPAAQVMAQAGASAPRSGQPAGKPQLSTPEYLARYEPRVKGFAWTAPVYDEATKPVRAPYPAACVQSKTRCTCYTQQATKMDVQDDVCKQIAAGGFFLAWDDGQGRAVQAVKASASPQAVNMPGAHNLTPSAAIVPASVSTATQDGESLAAARRSASGK